MFNVIKELKDYIYAGNSTFAIRTPTHEFWYNVKLAFGAKRVYNVYSLKPIKLYLGKCFTTLRYPFQRECLEYGRVDVDTFADLVDELQNNRLPLNYTIVPGHTCAKCGKLLTDEKSIKRGYGSECWRKR